jgi:hypothetical protein
METPPKTEHSKPLVEGQSSTLIGPEAEPEGQGAEGPSVQEKESEDSKFGGAPESVPRQEPSQEKGSETDHEVQEPGEAALYQLPAIPQTIHSVPISQIRPTIGFMVEVEVQGVTVEAVVDTGAEVSVLSKRVYDELDPKPPIKQYVTLTQAGENAKMSGSITGPVEMRLGSTGYSGDLYVAPLQDQMLIGMEFLHRRKARLDLENGVDDFGPRHGAHEVWTGGRTIGSPSSYGPVYPDSCSRPVPLSFR